MSSSTENQSHSHSSGGDNPAADLIRQKISAIYSGEPDAVEEAEEVREHHGGQMSKHQRYMKQLTTSGKSLEEIQTDWHKYYAELPDREKHEVWQEFYAEHNKQADRKEPEPEKPKVIASPEQIVASAFQPDEGRMPAVHHIQDKPVHHKKHVPRSMSDVKKQLLGNVNHRTQAKLKAKQHFQSLLFGVGMGSLVVIILLFSFFNDRFIAPFITPSKNVSSTPIIIDGSTSIDSGEPKILIPKINVEIPVVYDEPSIEEHAIQNALERGVVHYGTTPNPGEKGNAVIFGHSSNNILNKGKYKFAFVLLNRLEAGDTFYLAKDKTRYAYKIYEKRIVKPTELGVLDSTDKPASVTLITCDPPGTSLNRLIVIGEQISPDPTGNKPSFAKANDSRPNIIPSNPESLWSRLTGVFR